MAEYADTRRVVLGGPSPKSGKTFRYIKAAQLPLRSILRIRLLFPWRRTLTATSDWRPRPLWLLPFAMEATMRRGFRLEVACGPSLAMARTRPLENNAERRFSAPEPRKFFRRLLLCFLPSFPLACLLAGCGLVQVPLAQQREASQRRAQPRPWNLIRGKPSNRRHRRRPSAAGTLGGE